MCESTAVACYILCSLADTVLPQAAIDMWEVPVVIRLGGAWWLHSLALCCCCAMRQLSQYGQKYKLLVHFLHSWIWV